MNTQRAEFIAGQRPEDVHIYIDADAVSNIDALTEHGERTEDGIVLVMDGEQARGVFQSATGIDPMALAQEAMDTDGSVTADCTDGTCPADDSHTAKFIFSFAEAQNDDVGGLYAEGDVIHAYAACECGERYSDKWVADDR
ncbi:hypothetical protein SAMN05216226_10127 [Halovenus aranensis]|uniref:Uncharacterized protein n=1 Tax=Halovenus aranensis TaxID=890420 RepID=A0A1G8RNT0_9EURY|nr:DUF5807 family protein [Halovenus aranensis]SDJ18553.1 hypothetical protein SAMN05216226_10127 [Halovenus aranensis]